MPQVITPKLALAMLALITLSFAGFAQAPTGVITGVFTDESGAVMPNATVTITDKATGFNRAATSNAEGLFSAPALPAADYEVRAEAPGFRTLLRDVTL